MQTSNSSTQFSRREWWLLIALLLIIEYWIFSLSHSISGEQTIVNYVSFASSISSILLAVTAIIYSFIQADGQQKTAGLLSYQVEEIKRASGDMRISKDQLEGQLNRLGSVTNKIDELTSLVGGKFNTMEGSFAELRRELTEKAKAQPPVQNIDHAKQYDKTLVANAILAQTTWNADFFTYALYRLMKDGNIKLKLIDFISTHFAKPLSSQPEGSSYSEYLSVGLQIATSLRAVGLLQGSADVQVTLSEELEKYLTKRGSLLEDKPSAQIASGIQAIASSFN